MNKKTVLFAFFLFLLISSHTVYSQFISTESIVYDSVRHRYLVSDQGTGIISAIDSLGEITVFNWSFQAVKGLMIRNDTLFCAASISGLAMFDLETGDLINLVYFYNMTGQGKCVIDRT